MLSSFVRQSHVQIPRVVTGEQNNLTAAHVVPNRLPKWVPSAWGIARPHFLGVTNTVDWPSRLRVGQQADNLSSYKKVTVRKTKLWPSTVRLSGIKLGSGNEYEMTDDFNKQILINAKLQTGKRSQKNRADWVKSTKEAKVRIGL